MCEDRNTEVQRENKRLLASITEIIVGGRSEARARVKADSNSQASLISRRNSGSPAEVYSSKLIGSLNRGYQRTVERKINIENEVSLV